MLLTDFNNTPLINSEMLYVVTYWKISTFAHTFLDGNMHCKVLFIVYN